MNDQAAPMTVLFVGDYLPRQAAPLAQLAGGAKVIANLECVIGGSAPVPGKAYAVGLGPEAFDRVAASGFAALSLANNHVYDAGAAAFAEMRREFERRLGPIGYGLADRPYLELEAGGRSLAVIGCLEACRSRGPGLFPEEKVEALIRALCPRHDRVVVTPHWGREGEYASLPSPAQRALAARWVRAGAHAVIGHHPHAVHVFETIERRPVYYSLGNFWFDHEEGRRYPLTRIGLAIGFTIGASPEQDRFERRWLGQTEAGPRWLDAAQASEIEAELGAIGAAKNGGGAIGDWIGWSRGVGPIYIKKSNDSWRQRFGQGPLLSTLAVWLGWNLLPRTMLLRLGTFFPDRKLNALQKRLEDIARP